MMRDGRGVLQVEEDPLGNSLGSERFSLSLLGLQMPDPLDRNSLTSDKIEMCYLGSIEHIFEIRL